MKSKDTRNAISSPELESGVTPSDRVDGQTIDQSGQDLVHANLSPRQAKEKELLMSDTSFPLGSGSSESASLTLSLGSRLQEKQGLLGSTLYRQRWKQGATPAGRQLPQLVVSVPRISEKDFTGWPTPLDNDKTGSTHCYGRKILENGERQKFWKLPGTALLTAWPTPTARDHKDGKECLNVLTNSLLGREVWKATPARLTATGEMLTGSLVETENGGQLNPEHSRWLMGLPPEWGYCGVTAMQSLPRKRKPSSKAI